MFSSEGLTKADLLYASIAWRCEHSLHKKRRPLRSWQVYWLMLESYQAEQRAREMVAYAN